MFTVNLPIPNLINQSEMKETSIILYFIDSMSSQKVLCWCCKVLCLVFSYSPPKFVISP